MHRILLPRHTIPSSFSLLLLSFSILLYATLPYPPVEVAEVDRSCMDEDPGAVAPPDEVPGRLLPFNAPREPTPVRSGQWDVKR